MAMEVEAEVSGTGLNFPLLKPVRRRFGPDALFFEAGNIERELLAKQVALDITDHRTEIQVPKPTEATMAPSDEEKQKIRSMEDWGSREAFCPIVGCGACLQSLEDFEDHYIARHMASCSVCSQVFPTSHLLSIHVSEAHDSFFQAKVARGFAMYECLVEGCDAKLKSYKNRQQHLVDKHKFPSSFEFFKKSRPSKKQRQKTQRKQAMHKTEDASTAMQVDQENIDSLVSAVSRLSTSESPSSISFGRRHTRGLTFVPRAIQKEKRPGQSSEQLKR